MAAEPVPAFYDRASGKKWRCIESDPENLTSYFHQLGASEDLFFSEVYGFDPELLQMVQRPIHGVVFMLPITPNCLKFREEELPHVMSTLNEDTLKDVFFMKQTVGNACGTVALTHIATNLPRDIFPLTKGSYLDTFVAETTENITLQTPEERAEWFATNDTIETLHREASRQPASDLPAPTPVESATIAGDDSKEEEKEEDTDVHYIAFMKTKDGNMVELDGTKAGPVFHEVDGDSNSDDGTLLLESAVQVAKRYMALDPDNIQYVMLVVNTED